MQTLDFFTPIVDDPFTFGAIAAANSLSDVYAMGGTPITAMSILCYPGKGDPEVLAQILAGGSSKLREADCALLGGHSVSDDDIKFGFSITGTVHPERYRANSHARPGDVLLLTKALGTGVIATALKRGVADPAHVEAATVSMLTLNRSTAEAMQSLDVHGCTDITGFGLLGHAREMALASNVTLEIALDALPLLPGARQAIAAGAIPGGLKNNQAFAECDVFAAEGLDPALHTLCYDPQTSGGLLISLPAADARHLMNLIPAHIIGRVSPRKDKALWLLPTL